MRLALHVTSAIHASGWQEGGDLVCTCSIQDLWIHRLVVQEAAEDSDGRCAHRNILAPQPHQEVVLVAARQDASCLPSWRHGPLQGRQLCDRQM